MIYILMIKKKNFQTIKQYNKFFEILDIQLFKNNKNDLYLVLYKFQKKLNLICKLYVIIYIF